MQTIDLKYLNIEQSIAAFVIPTNDGLALVESGPHSTLNNLAQGMKEIGYNIADVKHIFLTHIHFDHAGAAWWFAKNNNATIYVHPAGMQHLAEPDKLYQSAKRIYGDKMEQLWGRMETINAESIKAVGHGEKIDIAGTSFQAWHTPGHAVHHIAWQVDKELFTGDVAGCKIGNGIVVPPCPPPDIHVEDWLASLKLIQNLPIDCLHLTHYGKINEVQAHLTELAERLQTWANWMQVFAESQTPPAEITPLFQAYVKQELQQHGVDEQGILIYETANPSWMSVAGLLRYWHKKRLPS